MWHLYLDESGDLGFDFVNKKPSKFFTITILALSSYENDRQLARAVKKVLSRKLNPRKKRKRLVLELKATGTNMEVKKYFFDKLKNVKFGLYSVTINKRKVYDQLVTQKERVYNYVARLVLQKIPFEQNHGESIQLVIDKCKGKPEIENFNSYVRRQLEARVNPKTPLYIKHLISNQSQGLQACDMFCWGFFQKYERSNTLWLDMYKEKVRYDDLYFNQ